MTQDASSMDSTCLDVKETPFEEVRTRIATLVRAPYAPTLVAAYYDPARGFAGAMFDGLDHDGFLADNPGDRFTPDDIAAASLLDVRYSPTAVRALLGCTDIAAALGEVTEGMALWEIDCEAYQKANELWDRVSAIDGVGRTRTSKLLARKRPKLVPIVDSVIANALQLQSQSWRTLAQALQDQNLRHEIERLRPAPVSEQISTLRLLDVVVWMCCSRSTAAVQAQIASGAPPARELPGGA